MAKVKLPFVRIGAQYAKWQGNVTPKNGIQSKKLSKRRKVA
jgi:hypothetical protein